MRCNEDRALSDDEPRENCGIAAVYLLKGGGNPFLSPPRGGNASRLIPVMLQALQNRGQLASGIASYDPGRSNIIATHKEVGAVESVYRLYHQAKYESLMREYAGRAAIGHVRYATSGPDDEGYAQPFENPHGRKWKWFAFCFNGNIANYTEVRQRILAMEDYHLACDTDTEIILHHLRYALRGDRKPDFVSVFGQLARYFDGAYSIAFLNAQGDMIVARDPFGFRPLVYGEKNGLFAAASESVALVNVGFTEDEIRFLEPGSLIHVSADGVKVLPFARSRRHAHCFFEWVYFANVASTLDHCSVYLARSRLGKELARLETIELGQDTVLVPVPDTAKAAGDAMAHDLRIPSVEGLMRNRYLGRTFIEGRSRAERARRKYIPLREVLTGKRVILVEDSIVRSTTLRVLVGMIRERGGAREIHVRVTAPPIVAPCPYGIDMSSLQELFAPEFIRKPIRGELPPEISSQIAGELGVDSVRYLPVEAIPPSIGISEQSLCMGCITGEYPTPWGEKLYSRALETRNTAPARRIYE